MTLVTFFIGLDVVLAVILLCYLWLAIQDFFTLKEMRKKKESEQLIESNFFGSNQSEKQRRPFEK